MYVVLHSTGLGPHGRHAQFRSRTGCIVRTSHCGFRCTVLYIPGATVLYSKEKKVQYVEVIQYSMWYIVAIAVGLRGRALAICNSSTVQYSTGQRST